MTDPWGLTPQPQVEELAAPTTPRAMLAMLDDQANLVVSVGTGGPAITSVNDEYKQRRLLLRPALKRIGINDPLPWSDLWGWYGYYSQHLSTYARRRRFISEQTAAVRERLEQLADGQGVDDDGPADGSTWLGLEQRLAEAKTLIDAARTLDDWQDIGRRCREILIDLAGLVYRDDMLPAGQIEQPKLSDAKARLSHASDALFGGSEHRELRAVIRAGWDLANKVTHSGSIGELDAFASVQATVLLVRSFERASGLDSPPP